MFTRSTYSSTVELFFKLKFTVEKFAKIFATSGDVFNFSTNNLYIHYETLGDIIKKARQESGITMEELAFRLDVTPRYLYRIENEGKKPGFDVLYGLIRELSISSDLIFYPERLSTDSEIENPIRRLYSLDERSLDVIKATANALLETAITSDNPKK